MRLFLMMTIAAAFYLSGCAALGTIATAVTPTASKIIDTAVDIAVTAEILKDPATSHAKAVAFKAIATQVLADAKSPSVTIAVLTDTLNAQLVQLAPNPIIAASVISLTGGLEGALNNIMGTAVGAPVTQATAVAISGIAAEIIRVTQFYGA
jgi:hypothetical protein